MDYFRKVETNNWNIDDVYQNYKLAYPCKKRDQLIFAIQMDLELFTKDELTCTGASRLLQLLKKHKFPLSIDETKDDSNTKSSGSSTDFTSLVVERTSTPKPNPINVSGSINITKSKVTGDITQQVNVSLASKRNGDESEKGSIKKQKSSIGKLSSGETGGLTNELKQYPVSLWDIWESFLYNSSVSDDLFYYSPERYGIITCGEGISKRDSMPEDAYEYLSLLKTKKSQSVTKHFEEYLGSILDLPTPMEMEHGIRRTPKYTEETRAVLFFLQDMLLVFARDVYSDNVNLGHSESFYNSIVIHPVIRITTLALSDKTVQFLPGEEQLQAITTQLKKIHGSFDERQCYKGDGILRYEVEKHSVEIFLLETSSGYDEASKTKKGFDHHKATFGLLAMLKVIADEWEMASFASFSNIKLYFLHALGTKMRLWSLCSPREGVYVMKREWSVEVPVFFERRGRDLLDFVRSFWDLKVCLKKTMSNIKIMKNEHEEEMKNYRFKEYSTPEKLLSNIVNPQIIKLTEGNNSTGMGAQLPISFLKSSTDSQIETILYNH